MNSSTSFYQPWSSAQKIGFRFLFIFFFLFIAASNNGAYPFYYELMGWTVDLLHQFIPWVGKNILQLSYDITVFTNGSGDTTYDYVIVFCAASLGVFGTIIWSILDRKRAHYGELLYWLTVFVRYYVGLMLFSYGMVKVVKLQFGAPGPYRLFQEYGDSSPMGLAWTFLGFSKGYNLFMGFAEVSALLLLFRRTLTAGAIITLATAANVMAVNYFYDVPVKIVSTALVVMTLFLLLLFIGPLLKFFFTGEGAKLPVLPEPDIKRRWLRISKRVFKALIIGYSVIWGISGVIDSAELYGDNAERPPLYGLWETEEMVVNNDTIPPLMTDSTRWYRFMVQWEGYASLKYMNSKRDSFTFEVDSANQMMSFTNGRDTTQQFDFHYTMPDSALIEFTGLMGTDTVAIRLRNKPVEDTRLMSRGFHWISEYPYNR